MSPGKPEDYIQMNKRHWNAVALRNRPSKLKELQKVKDDLSYLEKWEPKIAPYLENISGKKLVVPQFGDGYVMLACAKKGAIVTGVDLSSEHVRFAKEDADYCGVKVNLVEADWQTLPKSFPADYFDLVVTECGIFIWIQDLSGWMKNACKVLRTGGKLVVSDFHAISMIADFKDGKVTFRRSYFDAVPEIWKPEGDVPPAAEFLWKLSDVINAAIHAGFRIDRVDEFYVDEPDGIPSIPNCFLLAASKE